MCGNSFNEKPASVDMCVCNQPCPGNKVDMCGGLTLGGIAYLSFYNISENFYIYHIFRACLTLLIEEFYKLFFHA
jgi:hypothetical protein